MYWSFVSLQLQLHLCAILYMYVSTQFCDHGAFGQHSSIILTHVLLNAYARAVCCICFSRLYIGLPTLHNTVMSNCEGTIVVFISNSTLSYAS